MPPESGGGHSGKQIVVTHVAELQGALEIPKLTFLVTRPSTTQRIRVRGIPHDILLRHVVRIVIQQIIEVDGISFFRLVG